MGEHSFLNSRWVYVYVLLIPFVNWGFSHIPSVPMPDGGNWSPMAIVTGLILVVRDLAQRDVGHWIIGPLCIGILLSFITASPEIALASAMAFGISECIDWLIYSAINRPLSKRILWSCSVSAPIDSLVFLLVANMALPGIFTWLTLATSIASKLAGIVLVYFIIRHYEARAA